MIFSLVLLSVAALAVAEPEAPQPRYAAPAAPSTPTLAYLAAPLVVGSQRAPAPAASPASTLLAYTAPAAPGVATQQQYVARTYNGITTLALEQRDAAPVAAPLVAAPAEPAPSRYVVTSSPARVVEAEPLRLFAAPAGNLVYAAPAAPTGNLVYAAPAAPAGNLVYAAPAAPAANLVYAAPAATTPARLVTVAPAAATPVAAPARLVTVAAAAAAPTSSSSQYFARNYNGVPTVTYFVVGPAPVTAPVAVAPQQGALPAPPPRRPASNPTPAGEPVNQGDVEVLDA